MNSRIFSSATRQSWRSTRSLTLRTPMQRRLASSGQQPSPLSEFYKTFTRPIAKVLLLAMFTYQLAYWGWVKLEQDEIRAEREEDIADLEELVTRLADPARNTNLQETATQSLLPEQQNRENSFWWRWWGK